MRKLLSLLLALMFVAPTIVTTVRADEGMWTFNNVPRAEIKRRYNFDVTDEWLRKVQMSSVRFNSGGSGSFVSADGLVLTNHHVAADTLQKLSTPQKNYLKEGFLARARTEELKAPDLELNVLMSIEDVTARVNAAVKPDTPASEANTARRAAIAGIEKDSTEQTKLRSDVVTLYQGGQYNLYRYKKYTDVRLVFAPEFDIAFFGGDPDNFTYPRYCLDMTLLRIYENDKPVRVENYLKWSAAGSKDGELVFVSGHPASTERLNTVAHLEYLRDTGLPLTLKYLERNQTFLSEYMKGGEEQARRAQDEFFGIENSLKAYRGRIGGLRDQALMRKKGEAEQALRRQIAADARKQKEYGDAFDQIARARKSLPSYERERRFTESAWGLNSSLFSIARTLVRLADESAKPNAERLPEYADARRASLELSLFSTAPIYEEYEQAKLINSLRFMAEELGASNPLVVKILNGKTPEARAAELVGGTKLKDVEVRRRLAQGGRDAIQKSDDPMIVLARSIDPESRVVRKRYEDEVTGVERAAYAKIARALFETQGTSLYPDATFTLRLSYGAVKGYAENGKQIQPFTTIGGAFEHAAAHNSKTPYQLPASWTKNKSQLNLNTPLNFVSTNDIIGGNSGSPVFNSRAELVGLIFDGNIQSLVGNFIYDESVNRSVSVDSRGMLETLRKIYNANELVAELTR
ncbi:MAG: S46 family peptidase [Pyrinomonadaceae bacterium]|nr:S46 family peptidase [Pyrinomonadaceae bacterium]